MPGVKGLAIPLIDSSFMVLDRASSTVGLCSDSFYGVLKCDYSGYFMLMTTSFY
jgi:hypothetical protein